MVLKFDRKNSILIVKFNGELDHHSCEHARKKIDGEILRTTVKKVIFDFSELSFLDSSGIGLLIGRYKNIRNLNLDAVMSGISANMSRIFEACGLYRLMQSFSDTETALKHLLNDRGDKLAAR